MTPEMMNNRYQPLAAFNAEVARGIAHTDGWKDEMKRLQIEYDLLLSSEWQSEDLLSRVKWLSSWR